MKQVLRFFRYCIVRRTLLCTLYCCATCQCIFLLFLLCAGSQRNLMNSIARNYFLLLLLLLLRVQYILAHLPPKNALFQSRYLSGRGNTTAALSVGLVGTHTDTHTEKGSPHDYRTGKVPSCMCCIRTEQARTAPFYLFLIREALFAHAYMWLLHCIFLRRFFFVYFQPHSETQGRTQLTPLLLNRAPRSETENWKPHSCKERGFFFKVFFASCLTSQRTLVGVCQRLTLHN